MLRSYKFRGQRIDNKEWMYGGYHKHIARQICPIGEDKLSESDIKHLIIQSGFADWNMPKPLVAVEVIPETVGMFTGLVDKNGVEIYEGDVMHWDSHWGWYVGYENGAFRRIPLNDIQRINWRHHTLQQEGLDTWEIIGNIHENPELIGKDKNMTNREWLNSLSDEELVKTVIVYQACKQQTAAGVCENYTHCNVCKLDWLKKEKV